MYCAVRKCVIVGMNQVEYDGDKGLLWHPEVRYFYNHIIMSKITDMTILN